MGGWRDGSAGPRTGLVVAHITVFFPIGTTLAGPLADAVGVPSALVIFAALSTIPPIALIALPAIRRIRQIDWGARAAATTYGAEGIA